METDTCITHYLMSDEYYLSVPDRLPEGDNSLDIRFFDLAYNDELLRALHLGLMIECSTPQVPFEEISRDYLARYGGLRGCPMSEDDERYFTEKISSAACFLSAFGVDTTREKMGMFNREAQKDYLLCNGMLRINIYDSTLLDKVKQIPLKIF